MNLTTVLDTTLRRLKARPMLAALVGAVAGPVAYFGGGKLGAARSRRSKSGGPPYLQGQPAL